MRNPAAFISYARRDDAAYGGRITGLRERLQDLVASAIGRDFEIFQDRQAIAWGQHWPTRLDEGLEEALFLIPILTPSYFNSEACRAELETFLELERRSGRKDRVLSLYFLTAPVYEQKADSLAAILHERQHRDWRNLRIDPLGSAKVRRALDSLAGELAAAIHARQGNARPPALMPNPKAVVAATEQTPKAPVERNRLAREYLEILPNKVRQLEVDAGRRKAAELERSREIQELTDFVSDTLVDLVRTFQNQGAIITFGNNQFPANVFSQESFQLKLYVDQTDFWSLHFVDREVDKIGLMLVRMTKDENDREFLTNDSIVFRWVGSNRYAFSLNSHISAEVRENVFDGLDRELHPISQAKQDLEKLMINLVKYELAKKKSAPPPDSTEPHDLAVVQDGEFAPALVVLSRGEFRMGSSNGDSQASDDEKPQHQVRIGYRIAVGCYAVTFEEWDRYADDAAWHRSRHVEPYRPSDEGWGRGKRPVINVSWEDIQGYLRWLSGKTGQRYRLLSEAEWEYACRAGTTTTYNVGSGITHFDANFGNKVGKTVEVGSYAPNDWGLYDMHGNVWEWVEDCWHDCYDGDRRPDDGRAWTTGECSERVLRGSSWGDPPGFLRSAFRHGNSADGRIDNVGFRVARTLIP
jgi:formylglycine-generating enzyme required for sulfatase activity